MADVRCNSIQEAIRFAKGADLLGVVTASEPILEAPRLVKIIKQTGLLLFTYGVLNNEVRNAKTQQSYGVDAVIVVSCIHTVTSYFFNAAVLTFGFTGFCSGCSQRASGTI
jgi:glycerophosphodiester phosphodiesterase